MIVPSIDLMNGRAVQLRQGRDLVLDGGDPLERLDELAVVGEVAVVDLDRALGRGSNAKLIGEMVRRAPCRVGGGIRDTDTAKSWLDSGAAKVMIGTRASPEFCSALPRERVIAALDSRQGEVVVNGWLTSTGESVLSRIEALAPHVSGVLLTQVECEGTLGGFDFQLIRDVLTVASDLQITAAGGITTPGEIAALDALGVDAQVGMALYAGRLDLGDAFAAPLAAGQVPQPWPTVVCDEYGCALGLVWSTPASLRRAIAERRGVYWSRSRNEIWVKGSTSGNQQHLKRVELDCDRDAIRMTVRQEGSGFCHMGRRSCWNDDFDLGALERVIASRGRSADERSGTVALFHDPALLAAKLVEEAKELAAAESTDEAVFEAADLIYFALTAVISKGGSLAAVVRELERRRGCVTRRPMTAQLSEGGGT